MIINHQLILRLYCDELYTCVWDQFFASRNTFDIQNVLKDIIQRTGQV